MHASICCLTLMAMICFVPPESGEEALQLLIDRLEADDAVPSCPGGVSWSQEQSAAFPDSSLIAVYQFAVREVHPEGGPGDPLTAPVLERFRVYAGTGEIEWLAMPEGVWVPYGEYLTMITASDDPELLIGIPEGEIDG